MTTPPLTIRKVKRVRFADPAAVASAAVTRKAAAAWAAVKLHVRGYPDTNADDWFATDEAILDAFLEALEEPLPHPCEVEDELLALAQASACRRSPTASSLAERICECFEYACGDAL